MTGLELKILRKKKGLTQQELANAIGTYKSIISDWERGKHEISNAYKSVLIAFFGLN